MPRILHVLSRLHIYGLEDPVPQELKQVTFSVSNVLNLGKDDTFNRMHMLIKCSCVTETNLAFSKDCKGSKA